MKRIASIVALCCFLVGGSVVAVRALASDGDAGSEKPAKKERVAKDPDRYQIAKTFWDRFSFDYSTLKSLPDKSRVVPFPIELTPGGGIRTAKGVYTMGQYTCDQKEAFLISYAGGGISKAIIATTLATFNKSGIVPDGWAMQGDTVIDKWYEITERVVKGKGGRSAVVWDFPLRDMYGDNYVVSFSRPYGSTLKKDLTKINQTYTPIDPQTNKPSITEGKPIAPIAQDIEASDLLVTICGSHPSSVGSAAKKSK